MATDPICGMTVDETTDLKVERGGETHHFCSEHCRQKFLAMEPTSETKPHHRHETGSKPAIVSQRYTCPMHTEVVSDKPGACPKCGMALEPVRPVASTRKVIYTCPMHPEIEQDHPGSCPKCGMDLVKKEIDTPMDTTMKMGSDSAMKM